MIKFNEINRIEDKHFIFPFIKYLPFRKPELEKFNGIELKTIESVLYELPIYPLTRLNLNAT